MQINKGNILKSIESFIGADNELAIKEAEHQIKVFEVVFQKEVESFQEKGKEDETAAKAPDLEEYEGHYNPQPWGSELYISSWGDGLAFMWLPTDKPGDAISLYEHVEGDTFKRVRDGRELSETITFERDANGKVYRYNSHGNYTQKMKKVKAKVAVDSGK